MELEIETTEEVTEECTCGPFVLVRYRGPSQEPSCVEGVADGCVVDGVFTLLGEDDKFIFAAPLDALLSVESVK
jgi:hypothetical protein